jgi:sterol desaturase/sphingolipid hydroxylase (fatty acid hydroxylase superfamily)
MLRHESNKYAVYIIGNHHLLHHKYPNYNYGEYWIDYICGTLYPNQIEYQRGLLYW